MRSWKEIAAMCMAVISRHKNRKWQRNAAAYQIITMKKLISSAAATAFGADHRFGEITNYASFKKNIPIREYESLRDYIERALGGESDVLWPGRPLYFCKTSGTTFGTKYIPITPASMPNHIQSARNALLDYMRPQDRA